MFVALNIRLRRGSRVVPVLVALLLGTSVVSAHGGLAGDHMGAASGGHTMVAGGHVMAGGETGAEVGSTAAAPLVAMCLAVAQVAALALGALALAAALAAFALRFSAPALPRGIRALLPSTAPMTRARPPDLDLLQVSRR